MPYYVYILSNNHNTTVYTGVTNDLARRVHEHKSHIDPSSFTTKYHVDKLVHYEMFNDPLEAIERKKQIKATNRKKKNRLIEEVNPQWEDLYLTIL